MNDTFYQVLNTYKANEILYLRDFSASRRVSDQAWAFGLPCPINENRAGLILTEPGNKRAR